VAYRAIDDPDLLVCIKCCHITPREIYLSFASRCFKVAPSNLLLIANAPSGEC
jgi:hypothetical protein